ncbi:MAG: hypothetical protein D4R73_07280 [Deltaproteobacteria bacterium]|jgi:mRNA interferase MazF|nr:MAG: hypothetical protein D4R73_07280 [Deltaproteobacteria bacterium]
MISEGQIVLYRFPQTDQKEEKLRPALVLRRLPGKFTGLNFSSVIRASRLAVVNSEILLGKLGQIDQERLLRVKEKIAKWIRSA